MKPGKLDLQLRANVPFRLRMILRGQVTQVPLNLSGYTALMHIRSRQGRGRLLLALSTENGRIVIDHESGSLTLHIDLKTISDITWRLGYYDLLVIDENANSYAILEGQVALKDGMTFTQ